MPSQMSSTLAPLSKAAPITPAGASVKQGQPILKMDVEFVRSKGYNPQVMLLLPQVPQEQVEALEENQADTCTPALIVRRPA